MDAKAPRLSKSAIEVSPTIHAAMCLLHEAYDYSQDVGLSVWEFAVEIRRLRDAGVSNSDLRWLACKGFVEHADEITSASQSERSFLPRHILTLSDDTCFIPTEDGINLAQQLRRTPSTGQINGFHETAATNGQAVSAIVVWNPERRELTVNSDVVKRFRVPAPNQQLVLTAFQEEGWPERIDDPLPPAQGIQPKRRLHATINCLNRNQKLHLIRFGGDGNGHGICWHLVSKYEATAG